MSDRKTACDPEALELFLSDRLADDDRQALEKHLDDCAECRERLERLAAEPGLWAQVHDFLSSADDVSESDSSAPLERAASLSRAEVDGARAEHILGFLSATDDPRMLGRFGGYEVAGVIGCGGMGVVLKGLDVALNRYVAIKALAPHL